MDKNKVLIIFVVLLMVPGVFASNNFNINSSIGELFFVNGSSGNIGIGTGSPLNKLNVIGDANVTGTI